MDSWELFEKLYFWSRIKELHFSWRPAVGCLQCQEDTLQSVLQCFFKSLLILHLRSSQQVSLGVCMLTDRAGPWYLLCSGAPWEPKNTQSSLDGEQWQLPQQRKTSIIYWSWQKPPSQSGSHPRQNKRGCGPHPTCLCPSASFRPDSNQVCGTQVSHAPGIGYCLQTSSNPSPQSKHSEQSPAHLPLRYNVINALIQRWKISDR